MTVCGGPRVSSRCKRVHLEGARLFVLGFVALHVPRRAPMHYVFYIALGHKCPSFVRKVLLDAYDG